jgi:hypothetical protein
MPCCDTGRNIQKYKGAAASTLQDVTDNGNTTTGDIITTSGFFIGDGSKLTGISGASAAFTLQETTDRGNTTSNVVQFTNTITSLTTSGNVIVAGNVTASNFYGDGTTLDGVALKTDLTSNVGRIGVLESKTTAISYTNSTTTISSNLEINGNLSITGNTYTINSDTLVIEDRIIGIANNNTSHTLDVGIVMQHPDHNIAIIHHGSTTGTDPHEHVLTIGYTQNTVTDDHITDDTSNIITVEVLGNLIVQNNLTISEGSIYGTINGSNTITTSGVYGPIKGSNTITAGTISTATGFYGPIKGSNTISGTTLNVDSLISDDASAINKLNASNVTTGTLSVDYGGTNITTYAKGDILIASATDTLSNLSLGTGGYVLTSNSTSGLPEWKSSSDLGTQVAQLSNGSYILGGSYNGINPEEWSVQASTSNTADYIVARDSSGDIFVSNVNAINIRGDGSGITNSNASNISLGTLAVARGGTGTTTSTGSGSVVLNTSPIFSGTVQGGTFSGSGSGLTGLNAGNISTGTLPVARGGTGAMTLNDLIQMGTHTTGNYVATITGGNGISSSGATSGESIVHTLSVDTKTNGGLVIENSKLAVDLSASDITGTLAVSDGGTNITSYAKGDILIASATNTLSNLGLGQGGYVLTSNATTTLPEWRSASDIGTTVATLNTGNYLTGGPYNGSSIITFNVEGTTTNTPSNLVARNSSGDIYVQRVIVGTGSTGTLSSSTWSGSTAKISVTNSTSSSQLPLPFMSAANGDVTLHSDSGALQYQASTGTLSSTQFNGSGSGLTSLNASNINSGTLSNTYGGTGFTSYNQGDLLVGTGSGSKLRKLSKGSDNEVLTVYEGTVSWQPASGGTGSSYWTQTVNNDIYYNSGNVSISNSTTNHTVHLGSNVIVNDTGNYDVFRVNGNVFTTGYFVGDGSQIINLKTIKTEADADIIIASDGGPVSYTNRFYR